MVIPLLQSQFNCYVRQKVCLLFRTASCSCPALIFLVSFVLNLGLRLGINLTFQQRFKVKKHLFCSIVWDLKCMKQNKIFFNCLELTRCCLIDLRNEWMIVIFANFASVCYRIIRRNKRF